MSSFWMVHFELAGHFRLYSLIFLFNVDRDMPRALAVLVMLPESCPRAVLMRSFSDSRRVLMPSTASGASTALPSFGNFSRSRDGWSIDPFWIKTARSKIFWSSRTLPGQSYSISLAISESGRVTSRLPAIRLSREKQRSGMSSFLSRRGGRWMRTTLRR